MTNREIVNAIELFAPSELAEEWDKVGFMIGSLSSECKGVIISLDLTKKVAIKAVENGCNLIVTHHPYIFKPIGSVDIDKSSGQLLEYLIKNQITVCSYHTNLDKAFGGIGYRLAQILGGKNIQSDGLGFVFEIDEISLGEFAKKVASTLNDKSVKLTHNTLSKLKKVYVVSGSGGDALEYEHATQVADVFLTGCVKHNVFCQAENDSFAVVEFSHYSSEIIVEDILSKLLSEKFAELKIIKAKQQCPYMTLEEL